MLTILQRNLSKSYKFFFKSNIGDAGSIPVLERSPGEGNGNPLQYPFNTVLMLLNCVLKKTLESPLGSKEIKPVNHKGNQS